MNLIYRPSSRGVPTALASEESNTSVRDLHYSFSGFNRPYLQFRLNSKSRPHIGFRGRFEPEPSFKREQKQTAVGVAGYFNQNWSTCRSMKCLFTDQIWMKTKESDRSICEALCDWTTCEDRFLDGPASGGKGCKGRTARVAPCAVVW